MVTSVALALIVSFVIVVPLFLKTKRNDPREDVIIPLTWTLSLFLPAAVVMLIAG